ncbi:Asp-tRNA(Asn)/Glu-tRNA(Gln) amidotransferase subunit GatB [Candidatus Dojkabacteria bacterium]|nr:Asp-tRNA(Asn)/Glu-tRNA(Gln) amidotransferase subunit GatB [Candidatus Dojkabacteria bacterium]
MSVIPAKAGIFESNINLDPCLRRDDVRLKLMKYQPIIGFEVHLQPKTKSKMFSTVSADYFGKAPNVNVDPVTLGLPGAMPVPNKEAIDKCVLLALAMNCSINQKTKFDRKNYFYPDLPKGYQISQFDKPIGYEGYIEFDINGDSRRIRITRVHMEEDTGKSTHEGSETFLDYNKAGVPLIEIVTEPDFQDVDEVDKFAKRLRQIVRYLGISDADMEKGQLRYELNISLKRPEAKGLPNYKIEVKNIASISVLKKVIESEIKRQSEILDKGEVPKQETRGLRGMSGGTSSQRSKETSEDYRYFPEPDIPEIEFSAEYIANIQKRIVELPQLKKQRYQQAYGLEPDTAEVLVSSKPRFEYFESCIQAIEKQNFKDKVAAAKEVAKWILGDLASLMKLGKVKFKDLKVSPENIVELLRLLSENKISGSIAKQVLKGVFETQKSPLEYIEKHHLASTNDRGEIEIIVDEVLKQNSKVAGDIEKNPNAIKFLVGQVMRLSKGKANPQIAEEIIKSKLKIK